MTSCKAWASTCPSTTQCGSCSPTCSISVCPQGARSVPCSEAIRRNKARQPTSIPDIFTARVHTGSSFLVVISHPPCLYLGYYVTVSHLDLTDSKDIDRPSSDWHMVPWAQILHLCGGGGDGVLCGSGTARTEAAWQMPTGSLSGSIILMTSESSKELLPTLLAFSNTIITITRAPHGPFT